MSLYPQLSHGGVFMYFLTSSGWEYIRPPTRIPTSRTCTFSIFLRSFWRIRSHLAIHQDRHSGHPMHLPASLPHVRHGFPLSPAISATSFPCPVLFPCLSRNRPSAERAVVHPRLPSWRPRTGKAHHALRALHRHGYGAGLTCVACAARFPFLVFLHSYSPFVFYSDPPPASRERSAISTFFENFENFS